MSKIPEYLRGHRDATRAAVTWLHRRAQSMNDPHAKAILDSAANDLGGEYSRALASCDGNPEGENPKGSSEASND